MRERSAIQADDSMVRNYVRAFLQCEEEHQAAKETEIARLEAEGHRIVGGGQVDDERWKITNFRTGEVLWQSDNGRDGYSAAIEAMDAVGPVFHIDQVLAGTETERAWLDGPKLPTGMPRSLADALEEWADKYPEDARAWVG